MLNWRRPGQSSITTQRKEGDVAEIVAGTFKGRTTGAPIAVLIWNKDKDSNSYKNLEEILRPGHADYPAMVNIQNIMIIEEGVDSLLGFCMNLNPCLYSI